MTQPAISIQDLTIARGKKTVIDALSLDIPPGRITGLLGPSGSGKTTLMRAIVGVQLCQSGTITVLGLPAGNPQLREFLAYVTQSPSIYGDLTVADNLHYFASLAGATKSDIDDVISAVDLEEQKKQLTRSLSGGQRARVSLACALVAKPTVLVLDEPTVGLDPVLRRELWQLFNSLAASGTTLLVSSHVMDEAAHCHELILLREGKVVAHDTGEAICQQTGTTYIDDAFIHLINSSAGKGL